MHKVIWCALASDFECLVVVCLLFFSDFLKLRRKLFLESLSRFGDRPDARPVTRLDATCEDAIERVVIGRGHRIVFVIVTSRTTNREAQEPATNDIDLVVDHIMPIAVEHAAQREQTHCGEVGRIGRQIELIRCELLADEPVERLIVVEGPYHIIAIRICKRPNPSIPVHQDAVLRI